MTNSAALPSTVLTAISRVLRARAPAVLSLDRTAATGSVRWFDRVYKRTLGDLAAPPHGIGSSDHVLVKYSLGNAMKAAVEHGHLAIVQRIHSLHPKRLPVSLVPRADPPSAVVSFLPMAAEKGNLEMFQWLLAHRTDDLCVPDDDDGPCSLHGDAARAAASPSTPSIASLSCCLKLAYEQALRHDQLHIARWLLENGLRPYKHLYCKAGDAAAASGDLEMVQWLHTNAIPHSFTQRAITRAVQHGHRHVVEYLLTNRSEGFAEQAVHYAVMGGHEDIHELLRASGILSESGMKYLGDWASDAAKVGRLDLILSSRYCEVHKVTCMHEALAHGQLHAVQWIGKNCYIAAEAWRAARDGHLHILQWLHDHADEMQEPTDWSTSIDYAAQGGHLDVVKWLHENRNEGNICWSNAMVFAASYGHLEIVQWLHENRPGCSGGEIVEWLHVNRSDGCTTHAMTGAANRGHLEMVIWLHEHRHEGYAPAELEYAPLSVLQWLHLNHHEGWTTRVINRAAINGDLMTLACLHEHGSEGCTPLAAKYAAESGHLYTVQWLHDKYPDDFEPQSVAVGARAYDHHHIIQWLEDQQLISANE